MPFDPDRHNLMESTLKEFLQAPSDIPDLRVIVEKLRTCFLEVPGLLDDINVLELFDHPNGIKQRLVLSGGQDRKALIELCSCIMSLKTDLSSNEICKLAVTVFESMANAPDVEYWDSCLTLFLCQITISKLSDPLLLMRSLLSLPQENDDIKKCLQNVEVMSALCAFMALIAEAIEHSNRVEFNDYAIFFTFICNLLPYVRRSQLDFMQLLLKSSRYMLDLSSPAAERKIINEFPKNFPQASQIIVCFVVQNFKYNSVGGLAILRNLIKLNPKIFLAQQAQSSLVDFLLALLKAPVPSTSSSNDDRASLPTDAMSLFSELLQNIDINGLGPAISLQTYTKLFDVLRAFPVDESHSTARLFAWWRFICLVPPPMLVECFRRFVSPFLANLLGRYITITSYLGDPNLHRYKLSSASVYDGNEKANFLAAHVFSCFFDFPEISPNSQSLPRLTPSAALYMGCSYQLLVGVFHWLRYIAGLPTSGSLPSVGQIWVPCLKQLAKVAEGHRTNDMSFWKTFLHQLVDPSLRLVTPHGPGVDQSSFGSMIIPSKSDISCTPNNEDCLTILNGVAKLLQEIKTPKDLKMPLKFSVAMTCLTLLSNCHRELCSSEQGDASKSRYMEGLADVAVALLEGDPRLSAHSGDGLVTTGDDHVCLLRELLTALVPECLNFVTASLLPEESQDSLPLTYVMRSLHTTKPNAPGLRVWCLLADKLAQLTMVHKRVTELSKTSTEKETASSSADLSTMYAYLMGPLFLCGNSAEPISSDEQRKMTESLTSLYRAFCAEACLLTTVATNAWVDTLGGMVAELIQTTRKETPKKLNLNLTANFLVLMVANAEGSADVESDGARFSPSKWLARTDRPLGQMTGVADAICQCIAIMPLEDSETLICAPLSPRNRSPLISKRGRGRPPRAPLANQSPGLEPLSPTRLYASGLSHNSEQKGSSSSQISNLLHALWVILQRHARSTEAVLQLIEYSSTGLLALAKRLKSTATHFSNDQDHSAVVTVFEAYVTLAWHRLQKGFSKSGLVEQEPAISEQSPLKLPDHTSRRLVVFFEAAVCLAASPVSTTTVPPPPQNPAVTPVSPARKKGIDADLMAIRRRQMFLVGVVTLWDTLVSSITTTDLRDKLSDLTHRLSDFLKNETPLPPIQLPLSGRSTFPLWIPRGDDICEVGSNENEPPVPPTPRRSGRISKATATSVKLTNKATENDDDDGDISLAQYQERLRKEASSQGTQGSLTQTPPKQQQNSGVLGSFLASRRLGTSTEPRHLSPTTIATASPVRRRISVTGRRRLSLVPPSPERSDATVPATITTPIKRSVPTNLKNAKPSTSTLEADDMVVQNISLPKGEEVSKHDALTSKNTASLGSTKRAAPESDKKTRQPPNLLEFEDSAQFVFIPPQMSANKRMRLTEHQKEHRHEQKQSYIPSMYNDLDASQQSQVSQSSSMDSSSQSFIRWPSLASPPKPMNNHFGFKQQPPPPPPLMPTHKPLNRGTPTAITTSDAAAPSNLSSGSADLSVVLERIEDDPQGHDNPGVEGLAFEATQETHPEPMPEIALIPDTVVSQPELAAAFAPPVSHNDAPNILMSDTETNQNNAHKDNEPSAMDTMVHTEDNALAHEPATPTKDIEIGLASSPASPPHGDDPSLLTSRPRNNGVVVNASQAPLSPLLSGSPVVARSPGAAAAAGRSPLLVGSTGKRAKKILEMGLARAAERSRLRQSMPLISRSSSQATPTSPPFNTREDRELETRPGILRNPLTPRPRGRVSFVEKPVVFLLKSPSQEGDPDSQAITSSSSVLKKAVKAPLAAQDQEESGSATIPSSEVEEDIASQLTAGSQSQESQGISYSPIVVNTDLSVEKVSENESVSSSPNFVEGEQQDSSGSDARQFSPPNLPLGVPAIISRPNRKSSSPRRLNPFDRSSREAFRQSLSSSPQRRRSLFADSTGNKRPPSALNVSAIQERSITSSADTEGDTSKRLQVDIDASSLYTASHEEQIAASASPSTAASGHKEEGDEVIEETQEMQQMTEKADDTEDFVESSQEPDSSEPSFIMIPDTEKELDDREPTKKAELMDITLTETPSKQDVEQKHTTPPTNAPMERNQQHRDTMGSMRAKLEDIRAHLVTLPLNQQREFLFENLAIYKHIMS